VGRIAVTGSVAFDTIMEFGGRFGDHILPEKTNELNVAFLVERLEKRRGGTATNICFSMALLGEQPLLCAAVGAGDFGEYEAALEFEGVDTSAVLHCDDVGTATAFITTDRDGNQITVFYPGAMARAAGVDLSGLSDISEVVVGADDSGAMALHVEQARVLGAHLIFVPAQQIPAMSDENLRRGLEQAWLVGGNDYEFEMIRERTGLTLDSLSAKRLVAVTRGWCRCDSRGTGERGARSDRCGRCLHRRTRHRPTGRPFARRRRTNGVARCGICRGAERAATAPLRHDGLSRPLCGGLRRHPESAVHNRGVE
jgi:adenosine kinase